MTEQFAANAATVPDMVMKIDDYKLIRSKRRSIAIEVAKNGDVIVRANYKTPEKKIKEVLNKYEKWIEDKLKKVTAESQNITKKEYENGDEFFYLGELFPLNIIDSERSIIYFDDGFYLSKKANLPPEKMFVLLYKKMAKAYIAKRVHELCESYGFKYKSVRITSAKARWGSCSSKKTLNFSYRLIMAPPEIIDSVIIHELCHLIELNHSKKFWALVEKFNPNYKGNKKWLNRNEHLLR